MGSLITAVASYLDIKHRGGQWFVRIDDLDKPRAMADAPRRILQSLKLHGLQADGPVQYQSAHANRYAAALATLGAQLFYCACSRAQLADLPTYPGTCRTHTTPTPDRAVRLIAPDLTLTYEDGMTGQQHFNAARDSGDFIVVRRDGIMGYNFATAIDDATDYSHVLRGQDLAATTGLQLTIMHQLNLPPPNYTHIPVLCFPDGTKLSKQAHAPPLNDMVPSANLRQVFAYLGFKPPPEATWSPSTWLHWGLERWDLAKIPLQLPPFAE